MFRPFWFVRWMGGCYCHLVELRVGRFIRRLSGGEGADAGRVPNRPNIRVFSSRPNIEVWGREGLALTATQNLTPTGTTTSGICDDSKLPELRTGTDTTALSRPKEFKPRPGSEPRTTSTASPNSCLRAHNISHITRNET